MAGNLVVPGLGQLATWNQVIDDFWQDPGLAAEGGASSRQIGVALIQA